ncbi:hypothetical protein ACM01_06000 [Streptomyces viridochromogenes]|uniref:Uncharacterized protein n=1 Tax=Streptomyces viridochromogenes TaxID=1938 RepID=A0A0J7ZK36_STRVR|nr:hypothetical protein [Streptomyces viridochromogenes]KMS76259.1 hypothetical protein ACM01_06000 [Streptomyces viridochromogenes]KOG25088.1 hypothetical protein ADK36_07065 [Streptomyces viridochromogenes]KOG26555.1 hypothetical protein ADK35_07755 [Streptomyces viridochromogenes]
MTAFLALVAVVAFMATAGLPWWVVVAVTLLMAGFVAGTSWSPGKAARTTSTPAPAAEPAWSSADRCSTAPSVSVNVPVACPDEYTHTRRGEPAPMAGNS